MIFSQHYTDRSRLQTGSRCQRKRWWNYHAGTSGIGLTKVRRSAPLVTGAAVHEGVASLLQNANALYIGGGDVDVLPPMIVEGAVKSAIEYFDKEVNLTGTGGGLDYTPDETFENVDPVIADACLQGWMYKQQMGLTEALVRLSAMRIIPNLIKEFEIVLVEKEMEIVLPNSGAIFQSRADGLMKRRTDGEQFALSLKTAAQWNKYKSDEMMIDSQGLTEPYVLEACGFGEVAGAQMIYLIKGREMWNAWEKRPETYNHLIRAWADRSGPTGVQWGWKYDWKDATTGKGRRLGQSFKPVYFFDEGSDAIKQWMELLATGQVQPEAGDPLGGWIMPQPIYRNQDAREEWMELADMVECEVQNKLVQIEHGADPLKLFPAPLDRIQCTSLGKCEYYDLCWGPKWKQQDPEVTGEWKPREPHHSGEKEMIENGTGTGTTDTATI